MSTLSYTFMTVVDTWFMGRILERLPLDDYKQGTDALKQGLHHGNSDWAIAITASFSSTAVALALYVLVAAIWFVPDSRIEKRLAAS